MRAKTARITTTRGIDREPARDDGKSVIFFDIDNCLYSRRSGIDSMMGTKIRGYFKRIGIPAEEAEALHKRYYIQYGLAIRGLVQHHRVDPVDYDLNCDSALDLESVLAINPTLQKLLNDIDRSRYRVWCLTNAQANHAVRVLKLVGLTDAFDGVISCDYSAPDFSCKPESTFFAEALAAAGQPDVSRIYFVDDSALNVRAAHSVVGWGHVALFDELGGETPKLEMSAKALLNGNGKVSNGDANGEVELEERKQGISLDVIDDMDQLRGVWSEVFL